MRLIAYQRLTWRQGAWVLGAFGVVFLGLALVMSWKASVMLGRWPRIEAHVDTADVTTAAGPKGRLVYVARLRIAYRYQGTDYRTSVAMHRERDDYASAAADAAGARRAGHELVLLDPDRPGSAVPREGMGLSFVFATIFAVFGFTFLAVARLSWRTGQREGLDQLSPSGTSASPRVASMMFAGMGALFVISASVVAVIKPGEQRWSSVQGRVESTDLVQVSQGMFSVRTWYSYEISGQSYRAPVTANTARPFDAATSHAAETEAGRSVPLLVDPTNPERIATRDAVHAEAVILPAGFGLFGLVLIAIGAIIRRRGMGHGVIIGPI